MQNAESGQEDLTQRHSAAEPQPNCAKRLECVQLAGAVGRRRRCESGSKLRALQTLRVAVRHYRQVGITSGINRVLGLAGTHSTPDFRHHSDRQRCCLGATPTRGGEQLPGARVRVGWDSPAAAAQTGPAGVRATQTLGFRVGKHIFRQESSPKWKEDVGHRAHPTTAMGRQGPLA
jgi:hypothetical protein